MQRHIMKSETLNQIMQRILCSAELFPGKLIPRKPKSPTCRTGRAFDAHEDATNASQSIKPGKTAGASEASSA